MIKILDPHIKHIVLIKTLGIKHLFSTFKLITLPSTNTDNCLQCIVALYKHESLKVLSFILQYEKSLPALKNSLSTGADDAGRAKYLIAIVGNLISLTDHSLLTV